MELHANISVTLSFDALMPFEDSPLTERVRSGRVESIVREERLIRQPNDAQQTHDTNGK